MNIFQSQNFQEEKVKVELDLSNYATKADLKMQQALIHQKFAKKVDLTNLKSNVDKLHIDKLKNVLIGLSSLKTKVDKLDFGILQTLHNASHKFWDQSPSPHYQ